LTLGTSRNLFNNKFKYDLRYIIFQSFILDLKEFGTITFKFQVKIK